MKLDIYYKDEDNKYKLLSSGYKEKEKAKDWKHMFENVFEIKCKIVKGE